MQPYLDIDTFPGRTILTKLRINDLSLNAAGYNTKTPGKCPMCPTMRPDSTLSFCALDLAQCGMTSLVTYYIPVLAVDCSLTLNTRTRTVLLAGHVPIMTPNQGEGNWSLPGGNFEGKGTVLPI